MERSIFGSINNAAGLDPGASDLFDYFNPPSTAHAVIATFSTMSIEASMLCTSSAFLSQIVMTSSASYEVQNDRSNQQTSLTTTEGSSRVVAKTTAVAEVQAETRSPERSTEETDSGVYVPEFTDQQRRQLDEQLRNVMKHCFYDNSPSQL